MYEIKESSRRVTQYMTEQAYDWLYQRIIAEEYQVNRSKKAKLLFLQIHQDRCVNADTYFKFLQLFDHSPFHYLTTKSEKSKFITSTKIENYFANYNGRPFPIGFIKEFFEDDYEVQKEIKDKLLTPFMEDDKNTTSDGWNAMMIDLNEKIENLSEAYPGMLRPPMTLIVTKLIYTAVTIAMLIAFLTFFSEIRFLEVLKQFVIDNHCNVDIAMTLPEQLNAFFITNDVFCEAGQPFTIDQYLYTYAAFLLFNIVVFFILISRVKKTLRFLGFLIRVIFENLRFFVQKILLGIFEKKGVSEMGSYYASIIPTIVDNGEITPEMRQNLPGSKKILSLIQRFDVGKTGASLQKHYEKYKKYKFTFAQGSLATAKATWRKGLIPSILLMAIVMCVNIPELYQLTMAKFWEFTGYPEWL